MVSASLQVRLDCHGFELTDPSGTVLCAEVADLSMSQDALGASLATKHLFLQPFLCLEYYAHFCSAGARPESQA